MGKQTIDPIIAEVRAVRDAHAARFGYDVAAIFRDIREMQKASGLDYVRHPARSVSPADSALELHDAEAGSGAGTKS